MAVNQTKLKSYEILLKVHYWPLPRLGAESGLALLRFRKNESWRVARIHCESFSDFTLFEPQKPYYGSKGFNLWSMKQKLGFA